MEHPSDAARWGCLDQEVAADLDEAWHAHAVEVRRWCLIWMRGRREEAGEAFSRTWTRAAANYMTTRPKLIDRRAWLLTLAYHACMDLHRERTRRGEEELDPVRLAGATPLRQFVAAPRDPEHLALGRELAGVLLEAIDDLPPRLRETMRAYISTGNYRDVVERLGITSENARKRVQQGREILRKKLLDYGAGRRRPRRR